MKRLLMFLFAIGTFVSAAYAHSGMQHVMGTVTVLTATNLTVKASDGTSQTVTLTSETST